MSSHGPDIDHVKQPIASKHQRKPKALITTKRALSLHRQYPANIIHPTTIQYKRASIRRSWRTFSNRLRQQKHQCWYEYYHLN